MTRKGRIPGAKGSPESRLRNGAELRNCLACGVEFWVPRWQRETVQGGGKYCSRTCKYEALRDRPSSRRARVGTRRVRSDGYIEIKAADGVSWLLEHRIVAAKMLGRPLVGGRHGEHVHHVNGDKQDNRPENLVVMTNAEHQRLHDWPRTKPRRATKTCKRCGSTYQVKASKVAESRYCSNACRLVALHEGNRKG